MKKTVILLLGILPLLLHPKVPLPEAIQKALSINAVMKNQQLEEEAIKTSLLSAERRKWFTIDFAASYRFSSETIELLASSFPFIDFAKMNIPPNTILTSSPESTFDLKLALVQPFFTGGILSNAVRLEEARQAGEKHVTQLKAIEITAKVKVSYFTCQLMQKKIDSLQFMQGTLKLHLKKLESLYAEELIRKSDILETKSKIAEIDLNLQDLQQLLEMEKIQFQRLTDTPVTEVDADYREKELGLEESLEYLQSSHPFIKALDEKIRQFLIQKKIAGGSARPQMVGFAELHYGKPGMNFFKNKWTAYVQSGISFSLPLFNWNKTRRDKYGLDLAGEKIANQRLDFLGESEKSIRQLYVQKRAIESKMKLLNDLVSFSEEDASMKEKLYEENQLDHIAYLMAVTNLEKYRSQGNELQTQWEMVKASILTVVGKPAEEK